MATMFEHVSPGNSVINRLQACSHVRGDRGHRVTQTPIRSRSAVRHSVRSVYVAYAGIEEHLSTAAVSRLSCSFTPFAASRKSQCVLNNVRCVAPSSGEGRGCRDRPPTPSTSVVFLHKMHFESDMKEFHDSKERQKPGRATYRCLIMKY